MFSYEYDNIGAAWNGQDHQNVAFSVRWSYSGEGEEGHLGNAPGGAYFWYTGTMTVQDGKWSVSLTMQQADWYSFDTDIAFWAAVANSPASAKAAYSLQMEHGYAPFWYFETWQDAFQE